jgi:predicted DNA binding CopG/RHH family protein
MANKRRTIQLTPDEAQIEKDFLAGKYRYAGDSAREKLIRAAQKKDSSRITITVNNEVIEFFRNLSIEEGIPYQTLIHSVLYKFAKRKTLHA